MTSLQSQEEQQSQAQFEGWAPLFPRLAWMALGGAAMLLWPQAALASETGGHVDPGSVALALVIILIVAKLCGDLAVRLGQPTVL